MNNREHELQKSCVTWFTLQYKRYGKLLFAIPNGGKRGYREGQRFKAEGVIAGVSDLFLSIPNDQYHGFYIEMKFGKNKQTEKQKEFQKAVESKGYKYSVIYDFDNFRKQINEYLNFKT